MDLKIFAKTIEESATQQIYDMAKHPLFESTKIRIMPDCHAGKGCTIGTSYPITTFVNPSNVGVDIGCGIETYITDAKVNKDEFALIEHRIKKEIPFGFAINNSTQFEEKEFYKFMKNGYNKACNQKYAKELILDHHPLISGKLPYKISIGSSLSALVLLTVP